MSLLPGKELQVQPSRARSRDRRKQRVVKPQHAAGDSRRVDENACDHPASVWGRETMQSSWQPDEAWHSKEVHLREGLGLQLAAKNRTCGPLV